MKHFEKCVEEHGTDCWWSLSTEELLPAEYNSDGRDWVRGKDTLDVWFDSGTSWFAALQPRLHAEGSAAIEDPQLAVASSLVVEGSDQHRGWFQSSLLTSVAANGRAPYEKILSHGFVLDEDGRKMSKSIGNVMDPAVVINGGKNHQKEPAYGADVIRVWAASTDYTRDVVIGPTTLAAASSTLRKLRNTARFALGNLHDFDPAMHSVPVSELPPLERFMLHRLDVMSKDLTAAYDELNFSKVQTLLMQLSTSDLSAFYFDVIKDRLYCDQPDTYRRRSAQTVLQHALDMLTKAVAPIAPFTAEDVVEHLPQTLAGAGMEPDEARTAFRDGWLAPGKDWGDDALAQQWEALLQVRSEVVSALDVAQKDKLFGSSLEAEVEITIPADSALAEIIGTVTPEELAELFIVSHCAVRLSDSADAVRGDSSDDHGVSTSAVKRDAPGGAGVAMAVRVTTASGAKCGRCWRVEPGLAQPTQQQPAAATESDGREAAGGGGLVCSRCNF